MSDADSQTFEDDIEVHFPTTVMQRKFADGDNINQRLLNVIKNMERKYRDTSNNAVKSGRVSTVGGYQTSEKMNFFLLDDPTVIEFRDQWIMPAVKSYFENVFGEQAQHLNPWLMGWANVLNAGDWQQPHLHPTENNLLSAVYYLKLPEKIPEPQGWLEFINPNLNSVHHGLVSSRRLEPEQSKLVMFPPYYMHYVHPFKVVGDRVIIAFDVLSKKPGIQLVF